MTIRGLTTYSKIPVPPPEGSLEAPMRPTVAGLMGNFNAIEASVNQCIDALKSLDASVNSLSDNVDQAVSSLESDVEIISADILEIESSLAALEDQIDAADDAITVLQGEVEALESARVDVVSLTAAGGGSAWDLEDLAGYPHFRAVVIEPAGESNTLDLPAMTGADTGVFTVKCKGGGGTVEISAGLANIVGLAGGGSTLTLPYASTAGGVTITTYAVTLAWSGAAWEIIDTAIFVS